METAEGARFTRLATFGDPYTAELLAARLASEGIESRVHSPSFGPYPMTVGELAASEIWVLSDRVDEASTVLLDAEVNDVLERSSPAPTGLPAAARLAALGVAAIVGVMWVLRIVRVF